MSFDPIPLSPSYGKDVCQGIAPCDEGCLHQFIDNPRVAELPKVGWITFRYEKGPMTLREAEGSRPAGASADFRLYEITDVKAGQEEKNEPAEASDAIDKLLEAALKIPAPAEDRD